MDKLIITPDNALALNQAFENLIRSVFSLQKITLELKPDIPATGNFDSELQEYCRELQRNTKIQIRYSAQGLDRIPAQGFRRGTAYRVIQHLLYAAVRSAQAGSIDLELGYDDEKLSIQLKSQDSWLTEDAMEKQGGRYWREMQTLLRRNNGSITWNSSSGALNQVTIYIPRIS